MIRTVRLFGIPVLSIETTDDEDPEARVDDLGTTAHPAGFTADWLPTGHRREDVE